jgi:tetratricopeptide (TPR) repeat protein
LCQGILDQIAQGAEWFKTLPDARQAMVKSLFEQNRDLSQSGRANVLCRLGKVDQAIPLFEQSIERRRQGLKTAPDDRNLRDQLGLQLRNYGQYMMRSGKIADAVRLLGESHDLVEKNYLADPKSASSKRSVGHGLYYWGVARDLAGQPNDALALFERSRVLRQEMFDTSPDQANRVNLMLSLARLGNREPCLQQIEELKKSTARDPDLWLDIARAYSQLSQRGDSNEQRGRDQSSSIDCIKQAIESGLRDPYSYTTEPDLQPLQSLPDFRAIIAQI